MPMKIVDADIKVLRKTAHKRRSRSPEILQLIAVLEAMRSGQAKALVPEGKESTAMLRVRLSTASKAAGVKVRAAIIEDKVVFALKSWPEWPDIIACPGWAVRHDLPEWIPPPPWDLSEYDDKAADRKKLIQDTAVKLARGGRKAVSADDILAAIKKAGVDLNVARPGTAVGAVLRRMPAFKRVGKNKFEYWG